MKNKFLYIIITAVLSLILFIFGLIGLILSIGDYSIKHKGNKYLKNITNKFSESITIKNINETNNKIDITVKNKNLVISYTYDNTSYKFTYALKDNALTSSYDYVKDIDLVIFQTLLDCVSQELGYDANLTYNVVDNLNFYNMKYENGFEYNVANNVVNTKINTNISIYSTPENPDNTIAFETFFKDSEKINNDDLYDITQNNITLIKAKNNSNINTISIKEKPSLTTSTYETISYYIKAIYGDDILTYFKNNYPKIIKSNFNFPGFTIEYTPTQNENELSVFGSGKYEFIRIKINKSKITTS